MRSSTRSALHEPREGQFETTPTDLRVERPSREASRFRFHGLAVEVTVANPPRAIDAAGFRSGESFTVRKRIGDTPGPLAARKSLHPRLPHHPWILQLGCTPGTREGFPGGGKGMITSTRSRTVLPKGSLIARETGGTRREPLAPRDPAVDSGIGAREGDGQEGRNAGLHSDCGKPPRGRGSSSSTPVGGTGGDGGRRSEAFRGRSERPRGGHARWEWKRHRVNAARIVRNFLRLSMRSDHIETETNG